MSNKHSLSYLADLADNFLIERGINLIKEVKKNGEKVYRYTIKIKDTEKDITLNNEAELSYLGKKLFEIIYKEKDKKERGQERKIIL